MRTLFNDDWEFFELPLDENSMYENGEKILLSPDNFFESSLDYQYKKIHVPHDWMIGHVSNLYKNSVGLYKKTFTLNTQQIQEKYIALRFEAVYMNCGIYINGHKTCEWKYGYSTFETEITPFVHEGENIIQVIAVYQHCNTRWYSGAGIIRDVYFINTAKTHLLTDGVYFVARPTTSEIPQADSTSSIWNCKIHTEIQNYQTGIYVKNTLIGKDNKILAIDENSSTQNENIISTEYIINSPELWDIERPFFYICKTQLFNEKNELLDEISQQVGFRTFEFTPDNGFFLNGRHVKIQGVCHHHDQGALGAAFEEDALIRQFAKLKEMGVNAIRCSHNPPPQKWMDIADRMGFLIDDEAFDMWEKPKTPFDYGNYFNEWYERDITNWVKKDRNHPCLIMWSVGNEIYDTHMGNGLEITKNLCKVVRKYDPDKNGLTTIASNYMMTEGAQKCANEIDVVGYNYLERLYEEHHQQCPDWKIYGSETCSTVQSRGIYHFPLSLKLVTFSDGQCSTLGNCTTPWGAPNSQFVINKEKQCNFSAGQFIWTGWDYIGEPTPYHSKNSYFGQIDTAGFPKDTFYLYKSEWAGKKTEPFVHLLPYWDWNEGQEIDVKAYTNADEVELFVNGNSFGRQKIDHQNAEEPFGCWKVEYHKGEIRAVAYNDGIIVAEEKKCSFEDPEKIVLAPEIYNGVSSQCKIYNGVSSQCNSKKEQLHFIDIFTVDKNGNPVENTRNYITFNVTGKAQLVGMDNGDSTDYEEYQPESGNSLSRKLFENRLVAIVRAKGSFVITAASKDLPTVSMKFDGQKWIEAAPYYAIRAEKEYIPVRKIELIYNGVSSQCKFYNGVSSHCKILDKSNPKVKITAKVFPENATDKEINWNPVLKECVSSDYITVLPSDNDSDNSMTKIISAQSDGECILRCTAKNGSNLDEVISDLPFTVKEFGNAKLNPYKLIEACRFSNWTSGRDKPTVCLESGISNRGNGVNWVSFDKVDFGKDGADTIHLPIFSFETELPVEVWKGTPEKGECLGKFTYKHESIYNTYSENVFTLNRRLFGDCTISIVIPHELYLHGFYFDKTSKGTAKLRALDADVISGDTYTQTDDVVANIGNNVSLDFSNMNFEQPVTSLIICGKSNNDNNTINIKFTDDNTASVQVIEFPHTDDYVEKEFKINSISGTKKVSFVFLPGSNFDFKYFRFQ